MKEKKEYTRLYRDNETDYESVDLKNEEDTLTVVKELNNFLTKFNDESNVLLKMSVELICDPETAVRYYSLDNFDMNEVWQSMSKKYVDVSFDYIDGESITTEYITDGIVDIKKFINVLSELGYVIDYNNKDYKWQTIKNSRSFYELFLSDSDLVYISPKPTKEINRIKTKKID